MSWVLVGIGVGFVSLCYLVMTRDRRDESVASAFGAGARSEREAIVAGVRAKADHMDHLAAKATTVHGQATARSAASWLRTIAADLEAGRY